MLSMLDTLNQYRGEISAFITALETRALQSVLSEEENADYHSLVALMKPLNAALDNKTLDAKLGQNQLANISTACLPFHNDTYTEFVMEGMKPNITRWIDVKKSELASLINFIRYSKAAPFLTISMMPADITPSVKDLACIVFDKLQSEIIGYLAATSYESLFLQLRQSNLFSTFTLKVHTEKLQRQLEAQLVDAVKANEFNYPRHDTNSWDMLITPELQQRYRMLARYNRKPFSAPTSPSGAMASPSVQTSHSAPTSPASVTDTGSGQPKPSIVPGWKLEQDLKRRQKANSSKPGKTEEIEQGLSELRLSATPADLDSATSLRQDSSVGKKKQVFKKM